MKLQIYIGVSLMFISILFSCNNSNRGNDESSPVVKVGDAILTQKDLADAIPKKTSRVDSLSFVQNYISAWVKKELLLRKANLNLSPKERNVKRLLEDYRTSLLVHRYQQKLLEQKYVPKVKPEEVEAYYNKMSENFILQQDIIKGVYVKIPLTTPNLNQLKKLFRSTKAGDEKKLDTYCYQYANQFQDFSNKWTKVVHISSFMPSPIPTDKRHLAKNTIYEVKDKDFLYCVFIKESMASHEIAPFEYVKGRVETILLNKQRIGFMKNLDKELYKEGLEHKIVKYYN